MAPDWMPTHEMSLIGHQSVAEQEMEPLIQIYVNFYVQILYAVVYGKYEM